MKSQSDSIIPLNLFSDEPISKLEEDWLSLENWAKVVSGVALHTLGPFTIGIFGGWGTGKTSILQLAKTIVDNDVRQNCKNEVTTVSFNAWQYEKEDVPLIPLIASIIQELGSKQNIAENLKYGIGALRDALRSMLFSFSTKVGGKIPFLPELSLGFDPSKAIERYENLRADWIDKQIDQCLYYNAFKALREVQNESLVHRVIVFIDDLDRCFPDKAIQLLESIKLVLSQPGFIFVLAVDRRILEDYLEKIYKDEFGSIQYRSGQSYLDKIIQLPLWIPPHEGRFEKLIKKLLAQPVLCNQQKDFESLIEVISLACDHNPRQLKRFLNDLLVDQQVFLYFNPHKKPFPLSSFVVARGLRHQSEIVYQWLRDDGTLCTDLANLKDADKETVKTILEKRCREVFPERISLNLLQYFREKDSLLQLLTTDAAKKWFSDPELRDTVDSFLMQERQVDQWAQEQIEEALKKLVSDKSEDIISACMTLREYPHSVRPEEHDKLKELSNHANSTIKKIVTLTLETIEYNQYVRENIERALNQLFSNNKDDILAACQTFTAYPLPQNKFTTVIDRLKKLAEDADPIIKGQAANTLQILEKPTVENTDLPEV